MAAWAAPSGVLRRVVRATQAGVRRRAHMCCARDAATTGPMGVRHTTSPPPPDTHMHTPHGGTSDRRCRVVWHGRAAGGRPARRHTRRRVSHAAHASRAAVVCGARAMGGAPTSLRGRFPKCVSVSLRMTSIQAHDVVSPFVVVTPIPLTLTLHECTLKVKIYT